jgi:hypothetical protein
MGVPSESVVADASEADAVASSDGPRTSWNGFAFQGLDDIKRITLWALIESGSADADFDATGGEMNDPPTSRCAG